MTNWMMNAVMIAVDDEATETWVAADAVVDEVSWAAELCSCSGLSCVCLHQYITNSKTDTNMDYHQYNIHVREG